MRWHFGDRHSGVEPCPYPSTVLTQVHGTDVVVVNEPGSHDGVEGDALVTCERGAGLAIRTADCAPVLFAGRRPGYGGAGDDDAPVIGAAHAGWRGLYDGVIERTVTAMRDLGALDIEWCIGPCISPSAYEFAPRDLTTLALRFGPEVVGATLDGSPALDLVAAVRVAASDAGLGPAGLGTTAGTPPCTAMSTDPTGAPTYFSWRARRDRGRQLSLIWIER